MQFGRYLTFVRQKKNITISDLENSGFPLDDLLQIEHGWRDPSFEEVIKLQKLLNADKALFFKNYLELVWHVYVPKDVLPKLRNCCSPPSLWYWKRKLEGFQSLIDTDRIKQILKFRNMYVRDLMKWTDLYRMKHYSDIRLSTYIELCTKLGVSPKSLLSDYDGPITLYKKIRITLNCKKLLKDITNLRKRQKCRAVVQLCEGKTKDITLKSLCKIYKELGYKSLDDAFKIYRSVKIGKMPNKLTIF